MRGSVAVLVTLAVSGCHNPTLPIEQLEDPASCKECHPQHYAEWSGSMHAYASDDPVFVAMNRRGQREAQLGTFCVQCHAPMAVALGLTDGTNFDPTTLPPKARGITCYFCHDVAKIVDDHNNGLELALDDNMRGGVTRSRRQPGAPLELRRADGVVDQQLADVWLVPRRRHAARRRARAYLSRVEDVDLRDDDPAHQLPLTCSGCHMKSEPTT